MSDLGVVWRKVSLNPKPCTVTLSHAGVLHVTSSPEHVAIPNLRMLGPKKSWQGLVRNLYAQATA